MSSTDEANAIKGFTTGSAAAAAAVAALRFLLGRACNAVVLDLPGGLSLTIPVTGCIATDRGAEAWVTKDAGSDPDITHGAAIVAAVELSPDPGIVVLGGKGVGIVTKPGLPVLPGRAAINPGPMELIRKSVAADLPQGRGIHVTISAPEGEELAKRTYNPRLGIVGGISILGTTGIVNPMSNAAIIGTIKSELSVLRASGSTSLCLVPGNYGRRMAMILGVPPASIVNMSNFAGEALHMADALAFERVLLVGQIGKFAKLAAGSLDTHSARSDGRLEAIAAYAALHGAGPEDVGRILSSTMADEVATKIARESWGESALQELTDRIAGVVRTTAPSFADCGCLTFALPDRPLARTADFDRLVEAVREDIVDTMEEPLEYDE